MQLSSVFPGCCWCLGQKHICVHINYACKLHLVLCINWLWTIHTQFIYKLYIIFIFKYRKSFVYIYASCINILMLLFCFLFALNNLCCDSFHTRHTDFSNPFRWLQSRSLWGWPDDFFIHSTFDGYLAHVRFFTLVLNGATSPWTFPFPR